MAQLADEVRVAVTGAIYTAPLGTTLPTDATSPLNMAFTELGFVSEDGVVESQSTDTTDIKAWQNGTIVRKVQTSHDLTYAFTLIQSNDDTRGVSYGDDAITAPGSVEVTGTQPANHSWVVDVVDGDNLIRIVLPAAQVTDRDDVTYANGDAIAYGVTITAYPDDDAVKAYIYTDDGGS